MINTARYIFGSINASSKNTLLGNEVVEIKTGKTPSKQQNRFYEDDYFDWFKPDEIGSRKYIFEAKSKVSKFAVDSNQVTIYQPNTLLINSIGDVGRVSILKSKASSNQQITGIRFNDNVIIEYAYYYLVANRKYFYSDLSQTTLPIVNQKKLNAIPFVLPEIEEQRKIINGLGIIEGIKTISDLDIIDTLDWSDDYKNACNLFFSIQFNSQSLSAELTHQLTLVQKLRQQFLQEAVKGKLVPQDPSDEPAGQLLRKIKAEKEKLVKEKKIKQGKLQEAELQKEILFDVPQNWVWCKLDDICSNITDGTHQTPVYTKNGRIFLSAQNVKPFRFIPEQHKFVSEEDYQEYIRSRKAEKGDILVARVGAGIGEAAVIDKEIDFCFYVSLGLAQPFKQYISSEYLTLVINSPYGVQYSKGNVSSKGGSAGNFNLGRIRSFLIPLPPLSEQHRIVKKLEQLLQACATLEASIRQSQAYNEQLLQQVLREALQEKQ